MIQSLGLLDLGILLVYLATTLAVGLYAGRHITNIKDYALAGRRYGFMPLLLTYMATAVGGSSTVGAITQGFSDGIIMGAISLGSIVRYLFIGFYVAPRMDYFKGCISLGDVVAKLYGWRISIIIAIISCIKAVFSIAVQILALSYVCKLIPGISQNWVIVISGLIIILYSVRGGIKAVTVTDIIQFAILAVAIPLMSSIVVSKVGGIPALFQKIPIEKLAVFNHEKFHYYLVLFVLWEVFPSEIADPTKVQRMLMERDKKQLAKLFFISAGFWPIFSFIILLLSTGVALLAPDISPNHVITYAIHAILPIGVKGLAVTGMFAVIMSTADSFLNSAGIVFIHDIVQPIADKAGKKINELKLVKYFTTLLGILAIVLAFNSNSIVNLLLYSLGIGSTVTVIPLLAGILGLKVDARAFFMALGASLVTLIFFRMYLAPAQYYCIPLFCLIVNAITFFIFHLIQNHGRFTLVRRKESTEIIWYVSGKDLKQMLWRALPTPKNIFNYSKHKVATFGADYMAFALVVMASHIVLLFALGVEIMRYQVLLVSMVLVNLLSMILFLKKYFSMQLQPYFPVYWHFTLLYCLPVFFTFFYLIMGGGVIYLGILGLALLCLFLFSDATTFVFLSVLGISIAIGCYQAFTAWYAPLTNTLPFLVIYLGIPAVLLVRCIARKKEHHIAQEKQDLRLYGKSIAHDVRNAVGITASYAGYIAMAMRHGFAEPYTDKKGKKGYFIDKKRYELIKYLPKDLKNISAQGYEIIDTLLQAVEQGAIVDKKKLKKISLKNYLPTVIQKYVDEAYHAHFILHLTNDFKIAATLPALDRVFDNLIKNTQRYAGYDCQVTITLDHDTKTLTFTDNGPGIPPWEQTKIFRHFYTTSHAGTGIGLGICASVMQQLSGHISVKSKQGLGAYTSFILRFPAIEDIATV